MISLRTLVSFAVLLAACNQDAPAQTKPVTPAAAPVEAKAPGSLAEKRLPANDPHAMPPPGEQPPAMEVPSAAGKLEAMIDGKPAHFVHLSPGQNRAVVLPDAERPFNPSRQTELLWKLATEIGPSCLAICRQWFTGEGRVGQRRMWGLVGLARKHPPAIVEQACTRAALEQRATLKAITLLVCELAERASAPEPPPLTQQHELIRDAADYDDFFAAAAAAVSATREWLQ